LGEFCVAKESRKEGILGMEGGFLGYHGVKGGKGLLTSVAE